MGITERKLTEKENRRKAIIKAARKIFKSVGYEQSSMDMVADKTQLSKGTLYLYFKNKDDLYATCILEDGLKSLDSLFSESEKNNKSVEETIISYADAFYQFTKEYPELFDLMLGINSARSLDLKKVSEETRHKLDNLQKDIFLKRVALFQKGIDEKVFDGNFSTCYAVLQLLVAMAGALHLSQKPQLSIMFENIDPKLFLQDIAKIFIIAYSNSDSIRNKFKKEIFSNAIEQAPSSISAHKFQADRNNKKNEKLIIQKYKVN
jgi:AcrR family transcriptional regulator